MITRIAVSGFKNLYATEIRLAPFTCIAGPNAVGKSNLFDAIRFLSLLTEHPIIEAAKLLREEKGRAPDPASLFTQFGGYRSPEIRFSVDMVIRREQEDDFGVKSKASISSVRYEIAFSQIADEKTERLELVEEKLEPIPLRKARQSLGYRASESFKKSAFSGKRNVPFISTHRDRDIVEIKVRQEGHGGRTLPAPKSSRTALGGLASSDYPTLLAVHREMQSWRTLLLEPSAMRAPSDYRDSRFVDSRGGNLPAAIERLKKREHSVGQVCSALANRLSFLVDDVRSVFVEDDEGTETFTLRVVGSDGVAHPARSLSDGTLRFLVLAALAVDPETAGVLCLEEPENGIHPARIPHMIDLLRDIAVDPVREVTEDNPLRQVLVNTHSPAVVQQLSANDVVFLESVKVVVDGSVGLAAAVRVPPRSWRAKGRVGGDVVGRGHLQPYFRLSNMVGEQMWLDFGS